MVLCLEGSNIVKRCGFVFGGQQYGETVWFCVWRAAIWGNGVVLCLEGSNKMKRCGFVFGGQQYDETVWFCV